MRWRSCASSDGAGWPSRNPAVERRQTTRAPIVRLRMDAILPAWITLPRFLISSLQMPPASRASLRLIGAIALALAVFLAWKSRWFHVEQNLSRYPEIQLV